MSLGAGPSDLLPAFRGPGVQGQFLELSYIRHLASDAAPGEGVRPGDAVAGELCWNAPTLSAPVEGRTHG